MMRIVAYCGSGAAGSANMEKRERPKRVTITPQWKAGLDTRTEIG
jgi:hypothetical protein